MQFRNDRAASVWWIVSLVSAALLGCSGVGTAPLRVPDEVMGSLQLQDPEGQNLEVAKLLRQSKLTVMVFWAAGCPCVRRYQERADVLLDRWQAHGVRVIGVDANADETPVEIAATRKERGVRLPVWRDRGGALADALMARTTPTVVVLLPSGEMVYRGWIDNERQPGDPQRQAWLDDALKRALAGDIQPSTRPTYGCRITRGAPDDVPIAVPSNSVGTGTEPSCGCKVARPSIPATSAESIVIQGETP